MSWRSRKLKEAFLYSVLVTVIAMAVCGAFGYIIGHFDRGLIAGAGVGALYWVIGTILVLRMPSPKDALHAVADELGLPVRDLTRK